MPRCLTSPRERHSRKPLESKSSEPKNLIYAKWGKTTLLNSSSWFSRRLQPQHIFFSVSQGFCLPTMPRTESAQRRTSVTIYRTGGVGRRGVGAKGTKAHGTYLIKIWQYFRKVSHSQMYPQRTGPSGGHTYFIAHLTDKTVIQAKKAHNCPPTTCNSRFGTETLCPHWPLG